MCGVDGLFCVAASKPSTEAQAPCDEKSGVMATRCGCSDRAHEPRGENSKKAGVDEQIATTSLPWSVTTREVPAALLVQGSNLEKRSRASMLYQPSPEIRSRRMASRAGTAARAQRISRPMPESRRLVVMRHNRYGGLWRDSALAGVALD